MVQICHSLDLLPVKTRAETKKSVRNNGRRHANPFFAPSARLIYINRPATKMLQKHRKRTKSTIYLLRQGPWAGKRAPRVPLLACGATGGYLCFLKGGIHFGCYRRVGQQNRRRECPRMGSSAPPDAFEFRWETGYSRSVWYWGNRSRGYGSRYRQRRLPL